ncbi:hypothetical protein BKA81DRAFT_139081 [Phyllosticta paracitricarpa]|uniref:Secreted protein n=1 Tax=Phyllosticta paracitricarpa TaxID=2016321 RepID=A0ABR1NAV2_9PEZI
MTAEQWPCPLLFLIINLMGSPFGSVCQTPRKMTPPMMKIPHDNKERLQMDHDTYVAVVNEDSQETRDRKAKKANHWSWFLGAARI